MRYLAILIFFAGCNTTAVEPVEYIHPYDLYSASSDIQNIRITELPVDCIEQYEFDVVTMGERESFVICQATKKALEFFSGAVNMSFSDYSIFAINSNTILLANKTELGLEIFYRFQDL